MRVIYLDDERLNCLLFENNIKDVDDVDFLGYFNCSADVIEFVKKNSVDLAFLDIEVPDLNGIELAKILLDINENIKIVFVTGYEHYALQAFGVDAIGYLVKPFDREGIQKQVMKAKRFMDKTETIKIRVKTMPRFDIFIKGKVVAFTRSKPKELLALLVDKRGASVPMEVVVESLWPGRTYDEQVKALYRETTMLLRKVLLQEGVEDLVIVKKGLCYVDTTKFECDVYKLMNGDQRFINQYVGEYMVEYDWSDDTTYKIDKFIKQFKQ